MDTTDFNTLFLFTTKNMAPNVIEKPDSSVNDDVRLIYLSQVDSDLYNFIKKYPEISNKKFILLKPDEFNLFDSIEFKHVESVINLKLINQNPGFNQIFTNICNHLQSGSYYIGSYQSHSQVRRRIYYSKPFIRYFVHVVFIVFIGVLGVIPYFRDFKYIRDKYYSYSYMSKGLNKIFYNAGMEIYDKLITQTTTYFILCKN